MADLHFIVALCLQYFPCLWTVLGCREVTIGMFVVDLRTVQMVGYLCRGGWKKKIVFVANL